MRKNTFLVAQTAKNLPAMQETRVQSLGWKNLWRRAWKPALVFFPGEFIEQDKTGELQSTGSHRVKIN